MELFDEAKLVAKLARIEALFDGATTDGEKAAAANARDRIMMRLCAIEAIDPPREYKFRMGDMWSRRLFVALLQRYSLTTYRYRGQKHTTVMSRVSKRFVDETLWPQFCQLDTELHEYLCEVTHRVIAQAIHTNVAEPTVCSEPPVLGVAMSQAGAALCMG